MISWNKRCLGWSEGCYNVRSLVAYLLGFQCVFSGVCAERLHTHRIPVVSALPNIWRPTRSRHHVSLLGDVREGEKMGEGSLSPASSLGGANTPSPETRVHTRCLKSLCGGDQKGHSRSHQPAYLIKDPDKTQRSLTLQRNHSVSTPLRCPHLGENAWKLPGSYVDGRDLGKECVFEG